MKTVFLFGLLLLLSPLCSGQNISASRQPMYFGQSSKSDQMDTRFKSSALKENSGIDFKFPRCPLCRGDMSQIYSDTVMIDNATKAIKIVRCSAGNKILLSRTLPDYHIQQLGGMLYNVYEFQPKKP